ncbi:transposable element Tcb2 transposase [Trichonephila clavipes]|nr:transposable element Tcb2 transposase [Trichonephila clavipes]
MKIAGWSTRRVAGQVDRPECAVRNCWEHWTREGTHVRKTGSGATRKTNEERGSKDRAASTCGLHSDSFNDTRRRRRSNCSTYNFQTPFRSKCGGAKPDQCGMSHIGRRLCLVMNPGLFGGQMITVYRCGGALESGTIPPTLFYVTLPAQLQDNARPHTARVAQDFLRHFQTLPWPARSPDLSPVEHEWDPLKRQMPSCHSVHYLELAVSDLLAYLPQDNIRCLINSMPDRVAACIAAGGGPTRY